jgi:hypothetical protein
LSVLHPQLQLISGQHRRVKTVAFKVPKRTNPYEWVTGRGVYRMRNKKPPGYSGGSMAHATALRMRRWRRQGVFVRARSRHNTIEFPLTSRFLFLVLAYLAPFSLWNHV